MTTFAIHTLGCKVNSYESQSMCDDFKAHGYAEVDFQSTADIYIIHTCAVTNAAASKSRQKVRQAIKTNPNAIVCVVGCYVQTNADDVLAMDGVDVLIGSSGKQNIVSLVADTMQRKAEFVRNNAKAVIQSNDSNLTAVQQMKDLIGDSTSSISNSNHAVYGPGAFTPTIHLNNVRNDASFEEQAVMHFDHQVRAYLKVQDGCNQFCSYCIIPYTRGKERSLDPDRAVAMAKELVAKGHQEIVLAGIHTGRYGLDHQTGLVPLLKRLLDEVEGLQRLRLSSIEANEVTADMIVLFEQDTRLCRHLHIPLQSGEDATLSAMNRKYDTAEFMSKLNEIRHHLPNISISSDVIVGFPGESREDFEKTVAFIRQANLSFLHVFPYSVRQHTVAAKMDEQVEESEKKRRVHVLTDVSDALKRNFHQSFLHQEVQVLMEHSQSGIHKGYTSEYVKVSVPKQSRDLQGKLVDVIIDSCDDDGCYGHLA